MNKTIKIILIISIIVIALFLITLIAINYQKQKECKDYPYSNCPERCVVCPPCEFCSSLVCQTEDFCENIGFNRSWYEAINSSE